MVEAAIYITVPLLLEALAKHLNKPYEKLQEYYQTSKAFREYVTSLTRDFETEIADKLIKTTPSTTPRFDVPWITEQLKKKQQEIFNIKKELAANEINVEQIQRKEYKQPPRVEKNLVNRDGTLHTKTHWWNPNTWFPKDVESHHSKKRREDFKKEHGYLNKEEFLKKKAEDTRQANLQTLKLNHKLQQTVNKPVQNTDLRYKSYTERIHNAQRHQKTNEK